MIRPSTGLWTRRAAAGLLAGACALLAACGSGSVVSDLTPARFITAGDSFMDVGQAGAKYTVNDGSNNWVQDMAAQYGLTVTPAVSGGWGYAQGGARVAAADTTSGTNAPSITQQVDKILARTTLGISDVVILNGGLSDIVAAVTATGISDATTAAVQAAGTALGEQVKRVVAAGATHVLVVGAYNVGVTPWAAAIGQPDAITALSVAFNTAVELDLVAYGKTVLFVDPGLMHNLRFNKPDNYQLDNVTNAVCTTPTALTCSTGTLVQGADYTRWMYADSLNFTPVMSRAFSSPDFVESIYYNFSHRW